MNNIELILRLVWSDYKIIIFGVIGLLVVLSIPFYSISGTSYSCDGFSIKTLSMKVSILQLLFFKDSIITEIFSCENYLLSA